MTPRLSASSYSNTAPLIWSFLYGANHGKVELVLDNAPARSAELLAQDRVDAALVPVIASQFIDGVKLIPDVCVGAREKVGSVCLITKGDELENVKTVSLDLSSRTSVVLTKIVFQEFLGFEPEWRDAEPNIESMLVESDAALLIGDPALALSSPSREAAVDAFRGRGGSLFRIFDLVELWHRFTGLGFVFAMWMTRSEKCDIDFAAARDEGLLRIDEIVSNYRKQLDIETADLREYLLQNMTYSVDNSLQQGMELYFQLAKKNYLCENIRELRYTQ